MITRFKLFESLEEVDLQNKLANAIVDLYETENVTVQNNFYDYSEDEPSYLFRILDFYKNEIIIDVEYYFIHLHDPPVTVAEPYLEIFSYKIKNENVEDYLIFVLNEYDEIMSLTKDTWSFPKIKIKDLPEIIKTLSVDNYIIWKDVKLYNV